MPPKVLVVEDNRDTSQIVTLLLGLEGIEVITANDGVEGLKQCQDNHPDLIITDLMMPGLSGTELIKALRDDAACSAVPIIVLTAYAHEQASAALQAGANGVLGKTEDFTFLLNMVKGLLPHGEEPDSIARDIG